MRTRIKYWFMLGALTGAMGACYTEPYAYSEPVVVTGYPHYVYEGRDVYWVRGRWYHRRGPRWAYYRHEPRELYRHRVRVYPDRR